jgi:hypothetical protein
MAQGLLSIHVDSKESFGHLETTHVGTFARSGKLGVSLISEDKKWNEIDIDEAGI